MPWVESSSASFSCRYSSEQADDAGGVLDLLERTRDRLDELFPRTVGDLAIVLHDTPGSLVLARPLMPLRWRLAAPAARRYVTGWSGRREIHVLSPEALRARASGVEGSAQMLALTPASLYTLRVIAECNQELRRARGPLRSVMAMRWGWLLEGASRWLSGETDHSRAAIGRRLREGGRPSFPPGPRDAPVLGGTVIDLLAREQGEAAVIQLASRLHAGGPRDALRRAFGGRALVHTEGAWRSHLAWLAGGRR
ncbi:MAG TPA: hypothetical protein VG321_01070 [Solirubrobacteraceae bacterium]|jgi:hypothetical protein|nr:hypothetical protein [Solirubrobacteraceae bacterium]